MCKLVELVPEFVAACKQFGTESQDISTKYALHEQFDLSSSLFSL